MTDWSALRLDEGGVVTLIAGLLLLLLGRKLYWVFVGLVGFVAGFFLVERLVQADPAWASLLAGLLVGAAGAVLAVLFQKVAVALAGFVVGFWGVFWWASGSGTGGEWWVWLLAAVFGLVGAAATRWLFELALIVLSALMGAVFVLRSIGWESGTHGLALLALASVGIAIQLWSGRRISARGEDRRG